MKCKTPLPVACLRLRKLQYAYPVNESVWMTSSVKLRLQRAAIVALLLLYSGTEQRLIKLLLRSQSRSHGALGVFLIFGFLN